MSGAEQKRRDGKRRDWKSTAASEEKKKKVMPVQVRVLECSELPAGREDGTWTMEERNIGVTCL